MNLWNVLCQLAIILASLEGSGVGASAGKSKVVDVQSTVPWHEAYHAGDHIDDLISFVDRWQGPFDLHCFDAFGRSRVVETKWLQHGFRALAWDIEINPLWDITAREGFFELLQCGLRLLEWALILAGPPCSLFVWISRSVHKRKSKRFGIHGDPASLVTKISNLVVNNFVSFVWLMRRRRNIFVMIEQPGSSLMYELPSVIELGLWLRPTVTFTWLGRWGHTLPKPTRLWSTLPGSETLHRTLTKAHREKLKQRLLKAQEIAKAKGKKPLNYYTKDKNGKVTGGKDLGKTAVYPRPFAQKVFELWRQQWALRG